MSPKRKVTLYFNSAMLSETQREAIRQDRSISWIIQAAWKIAREEIRRLPGVGGVLSPVPAAGGRGAVAVEATPARPAVEAAAPARRTARD